MIHAYVLDAGATSPNHWVRLWRTQIVRRRQSIRISSGLHRKWRRDRDPIAGQLAALQRCRHRLKGAVGVGSDRLNCRQADNDDQCQHDRVLDRGWPVLAYKKSAGNTCVVVRMAFSYLEQLSPNA